MMRVRFIRRPTECLDEVDILIFRVGGIYDLPTSLANLFISEGCAEPLEEHDMAHDTTTRLARFGRRDRQLDR
jgi:hypothetical protein